MGEFCSDVPTRLGAKRPRAASAPANAPKQQKRAKSAKISPARLKSTRLLLTPVFEDAPAVGKAHTAGEAKLPRAVEAVWRRRRLPLLGQ